MDNSNDDIKINDTMTLLPVRDIVVFPYMVLPLVIGRHNSKIAVEEALNQDHIIFLSCQKDADIELPKEDDIYNIGTIATILRMMKLPDGKLKILVQGIKRGKIEKFLEEKPCFKVKVEEYADKIDDKNKVEYEAGIRHLKEQLAHAVNLGKPILPDLLAVLDTINDAAKLSDVVASNLGLSPEESQKILEISDPLKRIEKVSEYLNREISILEVQKKIYTDAKGEIDKGQREFFLREQLKAIKKELGDDESIDKELYEYSKKIKKAKMPKDVRVEAEKQLKRLSYVHQDSSESSVIRTYLDWLIDVPWKKSTVDNLDLKHGLRVLNQDHYGLEEVKDRIVDYLALRRLNSKLKSPILCLVGPPGVGKTSLGKSIAKAMGRKFIRVSMGGMRDEAEIRGHRRTYVGALPGKIIQGIKNAGSNNPVFMLDEIDKLGSDFRGDPASALLEVLDPVQNVNFMDYYLSVPYDLSNVLFITTANYLDPIPAPLKDRMEIINISGYTEEEKLIISEKYIIPYQIKESGLKKDNITFEKDAIKDIIDGYTRESGLRKLEQTIAKVCRKVGRKIVEEKGKSFTISKDSLIDYLGVRKFYPEDELKNNDIGVVTGLAWTPVGGEVLFVECTRYKGKGNLIVTGMLGDVMKESAQAAYSHIKTIAKDYGINEEDFSNFDIHIHVPSGAVPKDGPSAGITIATALLSVCSNKKVKKDVAMTGEITITGKVLAIGGLKEKLIAAKRMGVKTVLIPEKNKSDLIKLPKYVTSSLNIISVKDYSEVVKKAIIL